MVNTRSSAGSSPALTTKKLENMATRSRIAIENEDGTVTSIYCHFDGYVEHNGMILQEHYNERSKVEALIALGDLSYLDANIEPTGKHTFNDPEEGVTVAYHRDRGEPLNQIIHYRGVESFFTGDYEMHGYCFTKEGKWLVASYGGETKDLKSALEEIGK